MEYKKTASSLLPNRHENLEADLLKIIESGDFTSYESFKDYWRANNLSMVHHSIRPKEQRPEFYLTLYSILTDFIRTCPDLGSKAVFILFTVYFTQHKRPVLIPISPATVVCLSKMIQLNAECKNLVGKLAKSQAFDYCVCEGVKSFIRPKKSHNETVQRPGLDPELTGKINLPIVFNIETLHRQAINYMCSKESIKTLISDNLSMFKRPNLPRNELASHFTPENLQMLNLANPAFPLNLASKFSVLEKLSLKLESKL